MHRMIENYQVFIEHLPFLNCARKRRRQDPQFHYDLLEEASHDTKQQGWCNKKYNGMIIHGAQMLLKFRRDKLR